MNFLRQHITLVAFGASVVIGLAVASLRPAPVQAMADCISCQPTLYNYATLSGPYKVCVKSNSTYAFTQTQADAVASGKDYWNNYFTAAGVNISFSSVTADASTPCPNDTDITISIVDPSAMVNNGALSEANLTTNGHGATVHVNADQLSNGAVDWQDMGAHELGHILDFKDVKNEGATSGCVGLTIMWEINQTMPSSALCADETACSGKYVSPNTGGDDYYDPIGGECYDWYWVTTYYYYSEGNWYEAGETWEYIDEYCGVPPM